MKKIDPKVDEAIQTLNMKDGPSRRKLLTGTGLVSATAAAVPVDPPLLLLALLDELHAASRAEAAAVALTRPAPVSSLRRDAPSFMFSVCIASSTLGSIFFIADLQLSPLKGTP